MKISALALTAALFAAALQAQAADFTLHPSQKPQQLNNKAPVQVINFWATWCSPCRKEMPAMSRWYAQKGKRQNVQMVGIAVDETANISKFLQNTPVSYPIWRYTGNNSRNMMKEFGNQVGVLPYTVVRIPACQQQQALVGEVDGAKLDAAIAAVKAKCSR